MEISWKITDADYKKLLHAAITTPFENKRMIQAVKQLMKAQPQQVQLPQAQLQQSHLPDITTSFNLLFLGGSITMGYFEGGLLETCYPALFTDFMQELFPAATISARNLSYSSFHSILGLSLFERNKSEMHPNLIILEFAVNNGYDSAYIASFEGLIVRLQTFYPCAAIIIISAVNESGYSCESYMKELAFHYSLPHISISSIVNQFESYNLTWKAYAYDAVHPSQDGHILITDCIKQIILQAVEQASLFPDDAVYQQKPFLLEECISQPRIPLPCIPQPRLPLPCIPQPRIPQPYIPEALFSSDFANVCYYDAAAFPAIRFGGFHITDTNAMFPKGLINSTADNTPCIMSVKCKMLFLLYEQSNDSTRKGQLQASIAPIDKHLCIDSYSIYSWGNPVTLPLIDGPLQDYTIHFEMTSKDKQKEFVILGFLIVT